MITYCVNYNLIKPGRDYKDLINSIKGLGAWCYCGGSHWFVNTNLNTTQVRDKLKTSLDSNDQLIVHNVGEDWASYNMSAEVVSWLKTNWKSSCKIH